MPRFVVDYFELPTPSVAESKDFFGQAFGFAFKDFGSQYAEITEAGVLGGLYSDKSMSSDGPVIGIRTDDIEAAQQSVEAAGGTVTKAIHAYPGGRRFFCREPGGNELLVYCVDDEG